MRNEQNAVLVALRNAQQFLDTNAAALDAVNTSARKQLDDVVTQLSDWAYHQEVGTRGSKGDTARQRALLLAMRRNTMAPIATVAKLKLSNVPEFVALTMPPSNATPERAVAAAKAMADAATVHSQVFVDSGLPATFADKVRAAAAAVSAVGAGRTVNQGKRSGATAGLSAEEKRGRALLKVLNSLITEQVGDNPPLLAEWRIAKAVRRKPGPVAGSDQTSDVTPIHPASGTTPTPTAPAPVVSSA